MDTAVQVQEKNRTTSMTEEILSGLQKSQKTLPSKYFYDKRGSELFEHICDLDEYYLTRTELEIMCNNISEIHRALGEKIQLVELGSGSSKKTRLLLDEIPNLKVYVPVDISGKFLRETVDELKSEFPHIDIEPVGADYTRPFDLPCPPDKVRTVAYFPGSTIGNFTKEKAADFLQQVSNLVGQNGALLIGFDLIKSEDVLLAAYNDSQGVTAAFNKNILTHINRKLRADFDVDQFEHRAIFNRDKSRIEMHLISLKDQLVHVEDEAFNFKQGESIHTENSHKYSQESFRAIAEPYFTPVATWIDSDRKFCIQLLESNSE
ncbi:MAG: L-histidine N(alpha)-methyltransferase [Rhodohalobacter sp.]|uniref:L-histidine N(alpha)-methyltransferase n=1 Tax=Rhodohalobacter sp. TaxID=1974210 RepID=UPI0039752204